MDQVHISLSIVVTLLVAVVGYLVRQLDKLREDFSDYKEVVSKEFKEYASIKHLQETEDRIAKSLDSMSQDLKRLLAAYHRGQGRHDDQTELELR